MSEDTQTMEPEVAENEMPPADVQGMIQHAMDNEFTQANNIFGEIMTVKLNDLLDQEKVRLADQIYNGVEDDNEEELDDPSEDEQLELDLEGEGESESEEQDDEEDDEVEDDVDEAGDDDGLELEDE